MYIKKIKKKEPPDLKDPIYGISNVTNKTKILAVIISLLYISAIGICAYLLSGLDGKLGSDGSRTYTISRALQYGNKAGIITCVVLALLLLIYLTILRGPKRLLNLRLFLLTISSGLIISLLWVTVDKEKDAHYSLAGVIFTSMFIYQILTLYYFYYNNKEDKNFFITLMSASLILTTLLLVFACLTGNKVNKDIFATFEILFAVFLLITVMILGFYHN